MKKITVEESNYIKNKYGYSVNPGTAWYEISKYQQLSENFIKEFQDRVYWKYISMYQPLSEDFIREFQGRVKWKWISAYQHLSEDFIRKFKNRVKWEYISISQHLSEDFIREFQDRVDWICISIYQHLSEDFIKEFQDRVYWYYISKHQCVSKSFAKEFGIEIKSNCHRETSEWKKMIENTGLYECHKDYFYAYKGIRSNRYSNYNFQYQYLPGETYECFSDYSDEENSFGLSAWTEEEARDYCNKLVIKVKIYYRDVTAIVHDNNKIRCKKFTVMN